MSRTRRLLTSALAAAATLGLTAAPSSAIVGGHDAAAGAYPAVAEITFGDAFLCTGTLIAPDWVLTAGHCGNPTGEVVALPVAWPTPLINVRIGSNKPGQGEPATVAQAIVEPKYLNTKGFDLTLLKLSKPASQAPVPVAGASERPRWNPGVSETIVGFGTTSSGGSTPDTLQEAQVPVTTDAYCSAAYSSFEAVTQVCAGFPQGGVDTCQGDSGGPMFGRTGGGALRLVAATSYGEGCAQPGKPGVYARVADTELREWIRSQVPAAVGP